MNNMYDLKNISFDTQENGYSKVQVDKTLEMVSIIISDFESKIKLLDEKMENQKQIRKTYDKGINVIKKQIQKIEKLCENNEDIESDIRVPFENFFESNTEKKGKSIVNNESIDEYMNKAKQKFGKVMDFTKKQIDFITNVEENSQNVNDKEEIINSNKVDNKAEEIINNNIDKKED